MYEQTQSTQVYCFRCSTYFYFCRFEIIPRHYSGYVWWISQGYQSFSGNHYVFRHDVRGCLRWLGGALTDILVYIVRPLGSYNPVFTITNALMGILPALFFLKSQKHSLLRISLSTAFTQILCSFIINTLTLILMGFLPAQIA